MSLPYLPAEQAGGKLSDASLSRPVGEMERAAKAVLAACKVASTPPPNPFFRAAATEVGENAVEPIVFPLSGGNAVEIRLKRRVSRKDFDRLKQLLELSEDSLVEPGETEE
jgi:hypothetical protein